MFKPRSKPFWAALACCCVVLAAAAAPLKLEGKVTKVVDGDTLWLQAADGKMLEVRLGGIAAPELCQTWGVEAREALKEWVQGQTVSIKPGGKDEQGHLLASLSLGGDEINRRMVEEGHAWSLRTKWDRGPYVKQERMAHALGRGLHSVAGAETPADYRRTHGPCPAAAGQ